MADFLASFGIAPEPAAPSTSRGCASVEELQTQLRSIVTEKVTPTRSSHISTALQLRDTARFELNFSDGENEALAGLSNLDPSLGGLRSTPADGEAAASVRVVNASETLRNQPHSDPALQKAVAKHIVAAVGEADSSSWQIREVSRQGQGWTFTYHCKDSVQQWMRQNAKAPEKHVIGEWYHKDPDPILDNRPAFDCRGTLTIAFPRYGRSISIKYEHTPMHQTVAQLKEKFKPAPRPQPPKKTAEAKTPKSAKSKTPKDPKAPRTPKAPKTPKTPKTDKDGAPIEKKKRASAGGEGSSKPRKRKKKNDGEPQSVGNESSSLFVDSEHPSYDTPPATSSNAGSVATGHSGTQAAALSANANFPNVPPAEAARRKAVANKLLSEAGVNPASLSADQLSIFANQSPELQKDSLAMLVKYGAERLRIVQPTTEVPGQQPTPAPSTQQSANGAVTTKELVPQHRNSLPDTPETSEQATAANGSIKALKGAKMGKSRLVCYQCKERRVKCSKERPTCEECGKEGRSCEYPQQPSRASKKKSEPIVLQSDDEDDDDAADNGEDALEGQEAADDGPSHTSNWQMPVADMLGPMVEPQIHNPQPEPPGFYQPAPSLPLSHDEPHGRTDMTAASGLALLQNTTYNSAHTLPNPLQQHNTSQGIDPTKIQQGPGPQNSTQPRNAQPQDPVATASPTYAYQTPAAQSNAQPNHRRSTSVVQMQGRASPAQQMDNGRGRSRQGQRDRGPTPVNTSASRDPVGHAAPFGARNTGASANDSSGDKTQYQSYSHGSVSQQGPNNAGLSLPATMPSTTATSYASAPTGNQWGRHNTQQSNDRMYATTNSHSHTTNNQGMGDRMSLRAPSQQQQPHSGGVPRNHQSFGTRQQRQQQQQQQQTSQQNGGQQQGDWFGVNNANSGGSYGSFGQYWQS